MTIITNIANLVLQYCINDKDDTIKVLIVSFLQNPKIELFTPNVNIFSLVQADEKFRYSIINSRNSHVKYINLLDVIIENHIDEITNNYDNYVTTLKHIQSLITKLYILNIQTKDLENIYLRVYNSGLLKNFLSLQEDKIYSIAINLENCESSQLELLCDIIKLDRFDKYRQSLKMSVLQDTDHAKKIIASAASSVSDPKYYINEFDNYCESIESRVIEQTDFREIKNTRNIGCIIS